MIIIKGFNAPHVNPRHFSSCTLDFDVLFMPVYHHLLLPCTATSSLVSHIWLAMLGALTLHR